MTILQSKFVWFELETHDIQKAQTFYGELFGWNAKREAAGETAYDTIEIAGRTIGGMRKLRSRSEPWWSSFLSVPDLADAIAAVRRAGGRHVAEPMDTPALGRAVEIVDTVGTTLNLVVGRGGGDERSVPLGAFFWNELVTPLPDRAVEFYKTAFGFDVKPMEMATGGTYYVLESGGRGRGGILHRDTAPEWLPYVHVDNVDDTMARARQMGALELMAPTDIPKIGRYAVLSDPQGAELAIMKPMPEAGGAETGGAAGAE